MFRREVCPENMCDLDDLKQFGTREAQVTTGAQLQWVQRKLDSSLWGSLEAVPDLCRTPAATDCSEARRDLCTMLFATSCPDVQDPRGNAITRIGEVRIMVCEDLDVLPGFRHWICREP